MIAIMPSLRRILIAGGNDADLERYKDYLSGVDFQIQIDTDGTDALDCVRHFKPDLILLETMFAKVSGFDVCKDIKDDPSTKRTMILMVSAFNKIEDIERAVEAGTDDFLSKPVNKTELLKRIDNLLNLHDD